MVILLTIIHLDLDAFFVAVERLDNPALIGVPVIVGGRAESPRGGVLGVVRGALFGVHSAMPTAQALRLCPQAVLVSGQPPPLRRDVAPGHGSPRRIHPAPGTDLHRRGIPGHHRHRGALRAAPRLAETIQDRIEAELGLSASLGVATNKLVAKIASDFRKPHGITVVPPGQEAAFLAPLPIRRLWGVGEVTGDELARLGVQTIGDLARFSRKICAAGSARAGRDCGARRGIDEPPVTQEHEAKSLSREETFAQDVRDPILLRRELLRLSEAVAFRLRRHNLQARTIHLKLRYETSLR